MALPAALRQKNEDWTEAARIRKENLARLKQGQAPAPMPEPTLQPRPAVEVEPAPEVQHEEAPAAGPQELGNVQLALPAADTDELRRLQARNETTEGMLRKANDEKRQVEETSRFQVEAAQREAAAARQQLEQLQRQQPAAPLTRDELLKYVKAEQLDEFGEDQCRIIVAAVKAIAPDNGRNAFQEELKAVRAELEAVRQDRAAERAKDIKAREAEFWRDVNGSLPRWREVNANGDFLKWLNQRDPLAGRTRQDILNEARSTLDAERVLAIFNAWLLAQPKPSELRDPSRRVIPNGRPSASLPTEASQVPTITRAEIAEHNRRLARTNYRNSDEAKQMQTRIDQAARDHAIQ